MALPTPEQVEQHLHQQTQRVQDMLIQHGYVAISQRRDVVQCVRELTNFVIAIY